MNKNENFVLMEIQIWKDKNDEGLFNYRNDSREKEYFNFKVNDKDCYLIKSDESEIKLIKEQKEFKPNKDGEILFRLRKSFKTNLYEIINPIIETKININKTYSYNLNDKIWYPVKSSTYLEGNKQDYSLHENDIIKLGRKKYIIHKIHFAFGEEKNKKKDDNFDKNNNISYISTINKNSKSIFNIDIKDNQYIINNNNNYEKENEDKYNNESKNETFSDSRKENEYKNEKINISENNYNSNKESRNNEGRNKNEIMNESKNECDGCLFCFSLYSDKDNPLICLCNCNKYSHYECLKKEISKKIISKENSKKTVKSFISQYFNCRTCSKPYHIRFRIPEFDKIYELIDLTLPKEKDYICLESLDYIKDNNNIKTCHIVQLNDQEITIGRYDNNDIVDKDISISREHAVLKYNKNNGNLLLENKEGRFGTLVLVRGNIRVKVKTFLQVGKTKIIIEVKDKECSIKKNKNNNDNYHDCTLK